MRRVVATANIRIILLLASFANLVAFYSFSVSSSGGNWLSEVEQKVGDEVCHLSSFFDKQMIFTLYSAWRRDAHVVQKAPWGWSRR